mmetsp:Transcript_11473/g.16143  ORF Transcript_11473/g.16143 Transcript_11473/m.16143 type:complete len:580 (-) Transcript_11473:59-1798(-)
MENENDLQQKELTTPLLAADDSEEKPCLSLGPNNNVDTEESEGLIASLVQKSDDGDPALLSDENGILILDDSNFDDLQQQEQQRNNHQVIIDETQSLLTVIGGTLALMHVGFVWGAYLSSPWCETHVVFTVDWLTKSLLMLSGNSHVDGVVEVIDLGSSLALFAQAKRYVLVILVAVLSAILPCIAFVGQPFAIVAAHTHRHHHNNLLFSFMEWSMRFCMLIVYVLCMLDLSTSFIELHWTDTTVNIHNKIRGGLVSYMLGTTAVMILQSILRFSHSRKNQWDDSMRSSLWRRNRHESSANSQNESEDEDDDQDMELRPPSDSNTYSFFHAANGAYSYLSLEEEIPREVQQQLVQPQGVDVPATGNTGTLIDENNQATTSSPNNIRIWQIVVAWEFGLLAILLWIPSVTLPLFEVTYTGFASSFMPSTTNTVYFLQIPKLIWSNGVAAQTSTLWILLCTIASVMHVMLVPLVVLYCCVTAWWNPRSVKWLHCLHPNANTLAFAGGLILLVQSLQSVGSTLVNDSYGLCQKFDDLLGETCLNLTGKVGMGAWSCLGQALALEGFVILTLWAHKQQQQPQP